MDLGGPIRCLHGQLPPGPADIRRLLAVGLNAVQGERLLFGKPVALKALLDDVVNVLVKNLHVYAPFEFGLKTHDAIALSNCMS